MKIRACYLRIRDVDELGDVVYPRSSLHFHHAQHRLATLGRNRHCHSPAQILEVLPVIHLWLINDESGPILKTFSWPTRITGLTRSCSGFRRRYFKRRGKERSRYEEALNERRVKDFHEARNLILAHRWCPCLYDFRPICRRVFSAKGAAFITVRHRTDSPWRTWGNPESFRG